MELLLFGALVLAILGVGYAVVKIAQRDANPPDPTTLAPDQLRKRQLSETHWLIRYNNLPNTRQSHPVMRRKYAAKTQYVKLLSAEISSRAGATNYSQMSGGHAPPQAQAQAQPQPQPPPQQEFRNSR